MKTKLFNVKADGPKSGNIRRISYFEDIEVMKVKFKNGAEYNYEGISESIWEEALKAPSIGKYMHQTIIGKFKTVKL